MFLNDDMDFTKPQAGPSDPNRQPPDPPQDEKTLFEGLDTDAFLDDDMEFSKWSSTQKIILDFRQRHSTETVDGLAALFRRVVDIEEGAGGPKGEGKPDPQSDPSSGTSGGNGGGISNGGEDPGTKNPLSQDPGDPHKKLPGDQQKPLSGDQVYEKMAADSTWEPTDKEYESFPKLDCRG